MYSYEYPRPMFTTDCMVFNFIDNDLKILLIERGHEPFKGMWATPGGFMEMDEEPEVCAMRELQEETGIKIEQVFFSALGGGVGRDPRGRLLSAFYFTLLKDKSLNAVAGDDAKNTQWFSIHSLPACATDHLTQIKLAICHIKDNIQCVHTAFAGLFDSFTKDEIAVLTKICEIDD